VEVVRARCAVTEEHPNALVEAALLCCHRNANRMRDLGADRRAHREVAMRATEGVVRHLAAVQWVVCVSVHVVDVLLKWVATPKQGAYLSIAGNDPISIPKGRSSADDRGLFAKRAHVKRDASLPLNLFEAIVDDPCSHHGFVESDDLVDRQTRIERGVEASVVSNDVHASLQVSTVSFFLP
jgi:hypothetical protein